MPVGNRSFALTGTTFDGTHRRGGYSFEAAEPMDNNCVLPALWASQTHLSMSDAVGMEETSCNASFMGVGASYSSSKSFVHPEIIDGKVKIEEAELDANVAVYNKFQDVSALLFGLLCLLKVTQRSLSIFGALYFIILKCFQQTVQHKMTEQGKAFRCLINAGKEKAMKDTLAIVRSNEWTLWQLSDRMKR